MADYGQPLSAPAPSAVTPAVGGSGGPTGATDGPAISTLRKQYLDYLGAKSDEIKEQRSARHYYHADQWTSTEIAELNKRKQPVVTYNRIGRKVDGVVGLLERLRQDPKAYPRTPQHAEGAEVATATLRYALDVSNWEGKSPEAARHAATEGQGGIALSLVQGDHGDPEIDLEEVDNDLFFYDPRSFRNDYSDARWMGICKWLDEESAAELFPEMGDKIRNLIETGGEFTSEATRDRSTKWVNVTSRQIRVVDHWYRWKGDWCWCLYSGDTMLARGVSPYRDEKGQTICRYLMFAAAIDHDGDRYGFVRNLKSAQDEVNHRRSKSLFNLLGRRMIAKEGTLKDVEQTRREAVRPDGVIIYRDEVPQFDDVKSQAEFEGQVALTTEAKNEIEQFGPNQALVGQAPGSSSGRAIALNQQAGLAELGPFIVSHRQWKLRVYRAVWCAIQHFWTAERWIRVTDNEGLAQFVQLNGVGLDPNTGQPVMVNAVGALDVDIILDEGPDTINMQADAYEAMKQLPEALAMQFPEVWLELLPIEESVKKAMRDKIRASQQPNPAVEKAKEIELAQNAAAVDETKSKTIKNIADAHASMQPQPAEAPPAPTANDNAQKPPSKSINYADLAPEAQAQLLAQAGIIIPPEILALHQARQAALKLAPRPPAQPAQPGNGQVA